MDLDFYVRVRTCKKRVTGKQPYACIELKHSTFDWFRHFKKNSLEFYLSSRGANLFCSKYSIWMSNITILNVGRPNFSCEFHPTRVFLQFYCNVRYHIVKNREFLGKKVHKKQHNDETLLRLPCGLPRGYCCFEKGKSPKMAKIFWALVWKNDFKRS